MEQHEPIARGRAADVYAYGDGLILRRYRTLHSCLHEAAVMQYVRALGFPVPEVHEVAGGNMVMQRVEGPTMLADLGKHPARVLRHARTLADLQNRLHLLPAPSWVEPRMPSGSAIVHLDLHPDNVILSESGPVVIDWTNAGRGSPEAEVAHLWLIMATSVVPSRGLDRLITMIGRGLFLRAFLRGFDRGALRPHIAWVAEHRARDRNVLDVERDRIRRFVKRYE